jgi:hypothetical protein
MSMNDPLPASAVKKAANLVRDARLAVLVGLIPILGLIFILRLVQWYLLKRQFPILLTADATEHADLTKGFRSALPRLWFAVLFWPVLILFIIGYMRVM